MTSQPSYQRLLETSRRVNWRLEDLLDEGRSLDFTRPFLPETFAQTRPLAFLSPPEKLKLNQIRARGYLALFELVEAVVVPFIAAQADDATRDEPFRRAALTNFVGEEEKHRRLFRGVLQTFDGAFGTPCGFIGPAEDFCRAILGHGPLALTIATLSLVRRSRACSGITGSKRRSMPSSTRSSCSRLPGGSRRGRSIRQSESMSI